MIRDRGFDGVEGRHDRAAGVAEREQRQRERLRRVHVQDVEARRRAATVVPGPAHRPEQQPRHRAVVGHRNAAPGAGDPARQRRSRRRRPGVITCDVVAAGDQRLREIADVRDDATRHVPRVRRDQPDAHRLRPPCGAGSRDTSRSSIQTRCSMCQSAGAPRSPRRRHRRSAASSPGPWRRGRPVDGTRTCGWIRPCHRRRSGYQRVTGSSAAPVSCASAAGPAGIRAAAPKKSTSIPVDVRSRSASRQSTPPLRSRSASSEYGGRSPPVSGTTSMPSDSRNATNRSNSDSGCSRSATVVNGTPGAGRARRRHGPSCPCVAAPGSRRRRPRRHRAAAARPPRTIRATTSDTDIRGSRKTSHQYRKYDRIADAGQQSAARARRAPASPGAGWLGAGRTPLPPRSQPPRRRRRTGAGPTDSGMPRTTDQPAA